MLVGHLPVYPLSNEETAAEKLRELCIKGLRERYEGNREMKANGQLSQPVMDRLEYELKVINKLDAANYLLIVWDFIHQARLTGIRSAARGSASGCLVCYGLHISHVCPLKYGLLFERSLDDSREHPVELMIEICKERRSEMILLLKEKYGEDNVASFRGCNVVIGDGSKSNSGSLANNPDLNRWTLSETKAAGLFTVGLLEQRYLTILSKTVSLVEQSTDKMIELEKLPLDDEETFNLMQRGDTEGVFQLEGDGIREFLQLMNPDRFSDISATLAIYRPGPLEAGICEQYIDAKQGRKASKSKLEVVNKILAETFGVILYQEQVMQILHRVGGISLAEAYFAIKEISKMKQDMVASFYAMFMNGATSKGHCETDTKELWETILKYAGFSFCKSHAVGYALIAYQAAFLKTHYPDEFESAVVAIGELMRN